jgi:hypothetical protein
MANKLLIGDKKGGNATEVNSFHFSVVQPQQADIKRKTGRDPILYSCNADFRYNAKCPEVIELLRKGEPTTIQFAYEEVENGKNVTKIQVKFTHVVINSFSFTAASSDVHVGISFTYHKMELKDTLGAGGKPGTNAVELTQAESSDANQVSGAAA